MDRELRKFAADLHVHTALSPCADDSCTPANLVSAAVRHGLDIIAVTDHNSAENVGAVARCGRRNSLTVIPGMEVTTAEEVHLVCLLNNVESALALQDIIYSVLPGADNAPDIFGRQLVIDEDGATVRECPRLLAVAAGISAQDVVKTVHGLGGLAFAAHVDRPSYSLIANLGFVPPELELDALEISAATTRDAAVAQFPGISGYPLVCGSDAHNPDLVGAGLTLLLMRDASLGEIAGALRGAGGRESLIQ